MPVLKAATFCLGTVCFPELYAKLLQVVLFRHRWNAIFLSIDRFKVTHKKDSLAEIVIELEAYK